MADDLKIIFLGTSMFAVPSLKALIDADYDISLVVSQPDRRKGRGRGLSATPTKETALKHGIEVFQPESINTDDSYEKLKELAPDLMIVVSYGQLLKQRILDIPRLGCINIHASLLPELRGAAPINWAIVNGLKKTGVTSMWVTLKMDSGDILLKSEMEIGDEIDSVCLYAILSDMGGELLLRTLDALRTGTLKAVKQDESEATYAPIMKKSDGMISFGEMDAKTIHNMVRGFKPWPGVFTSFNGMSLKILKTAYDLDGDTKDKAPGSVIRVTRESFFVATKKGTLEIRKLQPQSKKAISAADFINGYGVKVGDMLGGGAE